MAVVVQGILSSVVGQSTNKVALTPNHPVEAKPHLQIGLPNVQSFLENRNWCLAQLQIRAAANDISYT